MVSLMLPSAAHDAELVPVESQDLKGDVAPHFKCLDLRNVIMSLMMLMASCEVDTNGSSIT